MDVKIDRTYSGTTPAAIAMFFINGDMNGAEPVEQAEKRSKWAENPAKRALYSGGQQYKGDQSQGFDKKKPTCERLRFRVKEPVPDCRVHQNMGIACLHNSSRANFAESGNSQQVACQAHDSEKNGVFDVGKPFRELYAQAPQPEQDILEKPEGAEQSAAHTPYSNPNQADDSENVA